MRNPFENTAPMKIQNNMESSCSLKGANQNASAPQENRKAKKTLVITRNVDPADLSMKESVESA
jgi:hypothetical protein